MKALYSFTLLSILLTGYIAQAATVLCTGQVPSPVGVTIQLAAKDYALDLDRIGDQVTISSSSSGDKGLDIVLKSGIVAKRSVMQIEAQFYTLDSLSQRHVYRTVLAHGSSEGQVALAEMVSGQENLEVYCSVQ